MYFKSFLQQVFLHFPTGIFFSKSKVVFACLYCVIYVHHFSWCCLCFTALQVVFLLFCSSIYGLSFYTLFCIQRLSSTHYFYSQLRESIFCLARHSLVMYMYWSILLLTLSYFIRLLSLVWCCYVQPPMFIPGLLSALLLFSLLSCVTLSVTNSTSFSKLN